MASSSRPPTPSAPSSPMASSSLPSSPSSNASSHASDASSSNPSSPSDASSAPSSHIKELEVASVDEMRDIMNFAKPEEQVHFQLAPNTSLAEAHRLWELVRADGGGESELINPDLLSNKEEALQFVRERLARLRRWKRHVDRKIKKLFPNLSALKEVIDEGGPGVPAGYQPHSYHGPAVFIDIEQRVDKENLGEHIAAIQAFLLQGSPGSPPTENQVENCLDRKAKEEMDMARFNFGYLELKSEALEVLSDHLAEGISILEERFVDKPTYLGAGDAEFPRFVEFPMYPGETPKEP